jgi:hypothetical protein
MKSKNNLSKTGSRTNASKTKEARQPRVGDVVEVVVKGSNGKLCNVPAAVIWVDPKNPMTIKAAMIGAAH